MAIELTTNTTNLLRDGKGSAPVSVAKNESTVQQNETGSTTHTDTVSMSDAGRLLNKLSSEITSQPVVDRQRVESIQQNLTKSIDNTDYGRVADKLYNLERQINDI